MQVLKRLSRLWLPLPLLALNVSASSEPVPEGCIPIDGSQALGLVQIYIRSPGHYCLTEDLHARIEMADRPAEKDLIKIRVGDVVLDLQGHTLGRGRLFKNPGGHGIQISDPQNFAGGAGLARNITIRNGVLQDFETGIFFGYARQGSGSETPTFDPATNTYHFPVNNVTLENITFKNNKTDFEIRMPPKPEDPNRPRATRYGPDCPQGCRVGRDE